jgi:hypothetical protein
LADAAVSCEPVSKSNSLIYRENTGKYICFGVNLRSTRSENAEVADAFFRNSLNGEQGIIFDEQGNFGRHQGIKFD